MGNRRPCVVVVALGLVAGGCSCFTPVEECSGSSCSAHDSGCVITSCRARGAECGAVADGCGGTLDCGLCNAPETCGGGGPANMCGCTAEPDEAICSRLDACGAVTAPDRCGSSRQLLCPPCPPPDAGTGCAHGRWPADGGEPIAITVSSLAESRRGHGAAKLDDGRVLIVGGSKVDAHEFRSSMEVFQPASGTWSAGPAMAAARASVTVHRLDDGTYLVIGADDSTGPSSERFFPDAGAWLAAGAVPGIGFWHASERLLGGGVIAIGGYSSNGVVQYDPALTLWSMTGALPDRRYGHRIARLDDGRVLITGGSDPVTEVRPLATPIYDPTTGSFTGTSQLAQTHHFHTLTRLCDGTMLVAGGRGVASSSSRVGGLERFDPATQAWRDAGTGVPREGHTATTLPNGKILLLGGGASAAEIYDPSAGLLVRAGDLGDDRFDHTATLLDDGNVLVAGGILPDGGRPAEKVFGASP